MAIADTLGLQENAYLVYRYFNRYIKEVLDPNAGDGSAQFYQVLEQYRTQYALCCDRLEAVASDIAMCESDKALAGLRRVEIAIINQMTTITKCLQNLYGLETINIRLFQDGTGEKVKTIDYDDLSKDELAQLMSEKLSG